MPSAARALSAVGRVVQPVHLSSIVIIPPDWGDRSLGRGSVLYNSASLAGKGSVTTTSSCFTSRRRTVTAALLLLSLCSSACSSGAAAPPSQELTLLSGIAARFTSDLIKGLNAALPQTHIAPQASTGGAAVVSAVDKGEGQLGLAQSDVAYLAYRRGIEKNQ